MTSPAAPVMLGLSLPDVDVWSERVVVGGRHGPTHPVTRGRVPGRSSR